MTITTGVDFAAEADKYTSTTVPNDPNTADNLGLDEKGQTELTDEEKSAQQSDNGQINIDNSLDLSDNDDDVIDLRAIGQDKSFASFSERIEEILHIAEMAARLAPLALRHLLEERRGRAREQRLEVLDAAALMIERAPHVDRRIARFIIGLHLRDDLAAHIRGDPLHIREIFHRILTAGRIGFFCKHCCVNHWRFCFGNTFCQLRNMDLNGAHIGRAATCRHDFVSALHSF